MERREGLRPSSVAWAGILGAVAVYELLAPNNETLSHRVDSGLEGRNRYITAGAIGVTALHLLNLIPDKIDPFEQGLSRIRQRALRARGH